MSATCWPAPGSTNISRVCPAVDCSTAPNSFVSYTVGTTARPHCLTDEMTVRSHRSCRPPLATAFNGTSVRRLTNGCTAATPSMTASRITRSILSLFSNACASVTATRGSGAAARGSTTRTLTRLRRHRRDTRERLVPLPVEDRDRVSRLQPQHAREVLRFVLG